MPAHGQHTHTHTHRHLKKTRQKLPFPTHKRSGVGGVASCSFPRQTHRHANAGTPSTTSRISIHVGINQHATSSLTKAKVSSVAEVGVLELVLLDSKTAVQQLHGLLASDGHVDGNLLISPHTKGTDGEASCTHIRTRQTHHPSLSGLPPPPDSSAFRVTTKMQDTTIPQQHQSRQVHTCVVKIEGREIVTDPWRGQGRTESAAPTPWRHGSACHQTHPHRCSRSTWPRAACAWGWHSSWSWKTAHSHPTTGTGSDRHARTHPLPSTW